MSKLITTQYEGKYKSSTKTPLNEEPVTVNAVQFTPVDLLASAYGSCLLGTIDYEAYKQKFNTTGAKSEIEYKMSEDGSKVAAMDIKLSFADDFTDEQKAIIESAAQSKCHVGKSLDPTISKNFTFIYNQE